MEYVVKYEDGTLSIRTPSDEDTTPNVEINADIRVERECALAMARVLRRALAQSASQSTSGGRRRACWIIDEVCQHVGCYVAGRTVRLLPFGLQLCRFGVQNPGGLADAIERACDRRSSGMRCQTCGG